MSKYNVQTSSDINWFKQHSKIVILSEYKQTWLNSINDSLTNPILRTYKSFKKDFYFEPYLDLIDNVKMRQTITRFRTSSHALHIESGRHSNTPLDLRVCGICKTKVEDEFHFLIECPFYNEQRQKMFTTFSDIHGFTNSSNISKFHTILTCSAKYHILGLGLYMCNSFEKRLNSLLIQTCD